MSEPNTAFKYAKSYKDMAETVGENPILLQSFVLSNNADIIKSIEYFENKLVKATATQKIEFQHNIDRLENIMVQRLLVTEDLFAQFTPLVAEGPQKIEKKDALKQGKPKGDAKKVIPHPASKGKKQETEDV